MSDVIDNSFTTQADFVCNTCGTTCKSGAKIYNNNGAWCINPKCGPAPADWEQTKAAQAEAAQIQPAPASPPAARSPTPGPGMVRFNEWIAIHNAVWPTCIDLANSAVPSGEQRDKHIVAQVFYKTAFGYINGSA